MENVINQMLAKYKLKNIEDKKNALKEVVQEVVLCGLSRAGFFKEVAFYGGTALRIFYGLDRFSEDLDFSLCTPNSNFQLNKYFNVLETEIKSLGLNFTIEEKEKTKETNIKSAFLKGNTKMHILSFYEDNAETSQINKAEVIKVKFEVDTNPPPYAEYEYKFGLLPSPYQVKLYDLPSLFAGKIHAVICRAWQNRIKGRDLYDFVFYLKMQTKVNLKHLNARLIQSKFINEQEDFNLEKLKQILTERFSQIDFSQAKEDILPFIKDKVQLDIWSKEFFIEIAKTIQAE